MSEANNVQVPGIQEDMAGQTQTDATTQTETQTATGDWKQRIPETLKDRGFWNNVKDEGDLFNQFAELQKYRGQSIKLPGDTATNEDWNSIYNKLGRPESPDNYEIVMRDYDGQVNWDPNAEGWVKNTAHQLGLNNRQTQQLIDSYGELILSSATEATKAQEAQLTELKEHFGDLYERKLTLGERALKKLGGDELVEHAQARGWDKDPHMVRMLMKLGGVYEESNWIDGRVGSMGKGEASAKLQSIMSDMNHPYWVGHAPGHKEAVVEVQKLEDIIYG